MFASPTSRRCHADKSSLTNSLILLRMSPCALYWFFPSPDRQHTANLPSILLTDAVRITLVPVIPMWISVLLLQGWDSRPIVLFDIMTAAAVSSSGMSDNPRPITHGGFRRYHGCLTKLAKFRRKCYAGWWAITQLHACNTLPYWLDLMPCKPSWSIGYMSCIGDLGGYLFLSP